MPIQFTCPHCGTETDVAYEYAGQSGPCAACGKTITVPSLAAAPDYRTPARGSQGPIVAIILILVVGVAGLVVCGGAFFWLLRSSGAPGGPGRPPMQAECVNNLMQIGIAMHSYHAEHGSFPPAYVADESGRPMHSWRVLLLPYLGEQGVYDQYNFDEPWNSPNNLALADLIAPVYRCPEDRQGNPSETSYAMIVGPGTISAGATATKTADIKDGSSRTIMVVEVTDSGIHWMEPRDLRAERLSFGITDGTPEGIRSNHRRGANALFCDGHVQFLEDRTDSAQIKAMTTIAGGEGDSGVVEDY